MLIPIKLVLVSTTCFFVACWCLLTGNNQVLRGTEFSIELSEKNTVDDLASLSSANECTGALNTNIEDEHVNQDTDSAVPENVGSNKLDDASTSNSIDGAVDGKEGELLDVDVSMQNQFSFKGQVEQEEQIDSGDTLDYPENCR
ncbi:hypothetical protein SARC_06656 [Sphaeroforma arctica JP610]|uniref:Uncharacterized protein n=1 Tax=Sphaeroforma arctica JP610 TaxID=667725 RepID=A0A0L0FWQ5_9EUKA|nr:hypothetical protein SARC_06656 [Sphaeroforma arctica JP610]KNC80996.1 hypothetical protein SARC_06656 [Sphaeroforma arctica JP610]|eukprot:XP_014154898.1 hypothetical protein SARC_06656 [Sphaeroforma arctica JP610]